MKQESVNTFNDGLNFDLNPLTTPNSILSDCVNGTFITFNGDELALQNDAGNTIIDYNGNPVKLPTGYYPIGIKEYGGILYIVSACNPNTLATTWESGKGYVVGEYVKHLQKYYICISDITGTTSPLTDTTHWTEVPEKDLNRIEFGSFPSPKRPILEDGSNAPSLYTVENTGTNEILYNSKIINNGEFRAGNYVDFTVNNPATIDVSNVSYYSYNNSQVPTEHKKVYKVKLLQQLTNGYIDLTSQVWLQFAKFKGYTLNETGTPEYWFQDPDFKFYCPNNYKGKLAIVTELEPLNSFRITQSLIEFSSGVYTLTFGVTIDNPSTLNIDRVKFEYWVDGVAKPAVIESFVNNVATIIIEHNQYINPDDQGHIEKLTYQITPLEVSAIGTEDYRSGVLPEEYITKNNYILSGTRLLTTKYDNIQFVEDDADYVCNLTYDGSAYATKLVLRDLQNNNLSPSTLTGSDTIEYYFKLYEEPYVKDTYSIGSYTINEQGYAVFNGWDMTDLAFGETILIPELQDTLAVKTLSRCEKVLLTIKTSKVLPVSSSVTVTQGGPPEPMVRTAEDSDTYTLLIKPNTTFTVTASYGSGVTVNQNIGKMLNGVSTNSTFSLAIIPNIILYEKIATNTGNPETNTYLFYLGIAVPLDMQISGYTANFRYKTTYTGDEIWYSGTFMNSTDLEMPGYICSVNSTPLTRSELGVVAFDFTQEIPAYSELTDPEGAPWINDVTNISDYLYVGNELNKYEILPKSSL